MRRNRWIASVVGLLLLVPGLMVSVASAEVRLPAVFADHMVLQRNASIPVWGWATPGEKVTVTLGEQSKTTTADAAGKWSVRLDALPAGGPLVLKVQGSNTLERSDVLVGEVWLCSGQSNMEMKVSGANNFPEEQAAADFPQIRMFTVTRKTATEPQADCEGDWKLCTPENVGGFSAAAYFFGRELHKRLRVPVGLIHSSWGGTPIQAWTSVKVQQGDPELKTIVEKAKEAIASYDAAAARKRYEEQLARWQTAADTAKAAAKAAPRKPQPPQDPKSSQNTPGNLYNAMIAPLVPYTLRGAIWYQGESNAGAAQIYGLQLRTMITSWRNDWAEGDFPFIYVQLPNYMAPQKNPSETGGWPIVREQMLKTLALHNAGMAVTIDIGEAGNIHPKDKQDVGKRLAAWALNKVYGKDVVACGPLYKSMEKRGAEIAIQFDYVGGGLVAKGEKLTGFAIAGDDKQFVRAEAKIVGNTVVVSSPEVRNPVAVRYAWANNPKCNLFNQAGLPASPFRTDDWTE